MRLSKRERLLVQILGGIILTTLAYFFIISPIISIQSSSRKEIQQDQNRVVQLGTIYRQYRIARRTRSMLMSQIKNNTGLVGIIDETAKKLGLKAVTSERQINLQKKYKKYLTSVRFESADITSVLKFLHRMENSNRLLRVSYLKIKLAMRGRDTYDVRINFESLAK